jgi:glycine/D-amino acid oxidase-like deaminating enzyme
MKLAPSLRRLALLACLASILSPALALAKDPPKVLVVVAVRAQDRQAYLEKVAALEAITRRLELPTARVWRATLAGEGTDTIYIATEYASAAAMAAAQQKLADDSEAQRFLRELDASGVRSVVDRRLLVEMTPE